MSVMSISGKFICTQSLLLVLVLTSYRPEDDFQNRNCRPSNILITI